MSGDEAVLPFEHAPARRTTILIVEDEVLIRTVAAEHLLDLGYEVLQAVNADEAVRVLSTNRDVDAVFSDISMPGRLNGSDLGALVRRDHPHIKVLLTSALAPMGGSSEAHKIPFLAKPYRMSELAERLRDMLALP